MNVDRRTILTAMAAASAAACSGPFRTDPDEREEEEEKDGEAEISAPEDLMREHGVLDRILLIYEEEFDGWKPREDVSPDVFSKPATLVRKFVEEYHEKLEEKFIFPRFAKEPELDALVAVLLEQHAAGRKVTDAILRAAAPDAFAKAENREAVVRGCRSFIRMYRPHAAREDTVLFPGLYRVMPEHEIRELGEQFEDEEHRIFGEDGFEKAVAEVAEVEKKLGIYDLRAFTAS